MTPSPPTSNLPLWFSADQGVALDGSGRIASWGNRQSGRPSLSQPNSDSRPVLVSGVFNDFPGIQFPTLQVRLPKSSSTPAPCTTPSASRWRAISKPVTDACRAAVIPANHPLRRVVIHLRPRAAVHRAVSPHHPKAAIRLSPRAVIPLTALRLLSIGMGKNF